MKAMFRKLLVANRAEIAIRVMKTARQMGVKTVAVASEADRTSLHAQFADEVVEIGGPEPATSYLDIEKIIAAARYTGAEAIHPGYGFLSERSAFSLACREAGIAFIGPSPEAMDRLGAKIDAKKIAVENGVPVTPGYFEPGATDAELKSAANRIGYPIMLKASAGGGGRGMRVVRDPADFDRELALASEEAVKGFGDGAMMVEKLVERPRHIEVQVLADEHGQVACLFERECSVQRRHQKLIEESPSPVMTQGLWEQMRDASRRLVLAAGYTGAGTVEFMVDERAGEFYFLEVNARLQVEHPVTELITGLDLVSWQLRIASGERLDLKQSLMEGDRSAITGHAIEARVVAEDPSKGFLPSVGKIVAWAEPKGPGVRFDTGYGPGSEVSRFYDSLLAKAIAHAESREEALCRLEGVLEDTHILGPATNVPYLLEVIRHPEFRAGRFDTGFLGREFADWAPAAAFPDEVGVILGGAVGGAPAEAEGRRRGSKRGQAATTVWDSSDGFRIIRS